MLMDSAELTRTAERASFSDLNGQIMRICNLLKPSIRTVNAVYSLCKQSENYKYTEQQIRQSLEYLCGSGYLAVDDPRGIACLADYETGGGFGRTAISITAKGMQLLMDAIQDSCVEV